MEKNAKYDRPSLKLRVKFLDDRQLDVTFPTWKTLMSRIANQRESFLSEQNFREQYGLNESVGNYVYIPSYDNVYALLGGRGSGKSSVLYTLMEKLRADQHKDIYVPLVVPEMISDSNCSILGWVLSSFGVVLGDLEKQIEKSGREPALYGSYCGVKENFFKNCKFQTKNSLRMKYEELFKISLTEKMNASGYLAEDMVAYQTDQARQQYRLLQNLNEFLNELTITWHSVNPDNDNLPMIFLFFDDIDIAPQRSMELLTTTFQFFTNPNIVILVTADENSLREVIYLKMLERMISSRSSSLLVDALPVKRSLASRTDREMKGEDYRYQQIDQMGQEFYDKVIAPSNRYYLNQYDTLEKKKRYCYSSMIQAFSMPNQKDECSIPIQKLLDDEMGKISDAIRNYKAKTGLDSETGNEKEEKSSGEPLFKEVFFLIFGQRNRNIANACLEIINLSGQLCTLISSSIPDCSLYSEQTQRKIRQLILHMISTLILAKGNFDAEDGLDRKVRGELAHFAPYIDQIVTQETDCSGDCPSTYLRIQYELIGQLYRKCLKEVQDSYNPQLTAVVDSEAGQEVKAELYHQLRSRQDWELGRIKKNFTTMFVLLFFTESIVSQTNPDGHNTLHGYYEFSQIINRNFLTSEYFTNYSEDYGEKKKDFAELIPGEFSTNDLLDKFPSLIEHVERYVHVDFYHSAEDRRRFLRDLMSWDGESCTREQQDKIVGLVYGQAQKNREWVRTVLCCLQIESSGIYRLTSNIFFVPGLFRELMNLFSFGVNIIDATKRENKKFLLSNDFGLAVEKSLDKLKRMLAQTDRGCSRLEDYLSCQHHMPIQQQSIQQHLKNRRKNGIWSKQREGVREEYIRLLWKNDQNQDSMEGKINGASDCITFANQFVRFYSTILVDLQIAIQRYGKLYLSWKEAAEIISQTDELLTFNNYNMLRIRSALVNELSRLDPKNSEKDTDGDLESDPKSEQQAGQESDPKSEQQAGQESDPKSEQQAGQESDLKSEQQADQKSDPKSDLDKKEYVSIQWLVSYLLQYQYEIRMHGYREYLWSDNIKVFNQLLVRLKLCFLEQDALPEQVVPSQMAKSMSPSDGFVLCLDAIQYLYPYYLAAQAYIETFNRSDSSDSMYQEVFREITDKLRKTENNKELRRLFNQVKETVAQQYNNYFEQEIKEKNGNE